MAVAICKHYCNDGYCSPEPGLPLTSNSTKSTNPTNPTNSTNPISSPASRITLHGSPFKSFMLFMVKTLFCRNFKNFGLFVSFVVENYSRRCLSFQLRAGRFFCPFFYRPTLHGLRLTPPALRITLHELRFTPPGSRITGSPFVVNALYAFDVHIFMSFKSSW